MERLRERHGADFRSVIFVPGDGLAWQWEQAISRWTGGVLTNPDTKKAKYVGGTPALIIRGDRDRRARLYDQADVEEFPYVIVKYSLVVTDFPKVEELFGDCFVGDEITQIANPGSQRSQALKSLTQPAYVYGLSGDPIENGQAIEVFSEMQWIDDTVFGRADLFDKSFVIRASGGTRFIVGYKNLPEFWKRLEPALVKIEEDDERLAKYMPESVPPRDHILALDSGSQRVYDRMAEDLLRQLTLAMQQNRSFDIEAVYAGRDKQASAIQGRIAARISAMRMLCDDPQVLMDSAEAYLRQKTDPNERSGSAYAAGLLEEGVLDDLSARPKFDRITRMIDRRLRRDSTTKVIVFCFFKGVLRDLHTRYPDCSVLYNGDLTAKGKEASLTAFKHDPATRLILSSDAGGYGLDLPEAQYLINFDIPFSAGRSKQRDTRHRRASSEFDRVYVDNFLMASTIEPFYATKTRQKRSTAKGLLTGRGADREGRIEVSAQSLFEWIGGQQD